MITALAKTGDSSLQEKKLELTQDQIELVKKTVAKDATNDEFKMFLYLAEKYGLDPFAKQIWFTKFGNQANIYAGRDGFLEVAHRSGLFNGMESGTTGSGKDMKGFCKVYRKDIEHPFSVEVDFSEYSTGKNLWVSKPKTMIQKVAESQCLRRAFSITGLYSPEEMGQWEEEQQQQQSTTIIRDTTPTPSTSKVEGYPSAEPQAQNAEQTAAQGQKNEPVTEVSEDIRIKVNPEDVINPGEENAAKTGSAEVPENENVKTLEIKAYKKGENKGREYLRVVADDLYYVLDDDMKVIIDNAKAENKADLTVVAKIENKNGSKLLTNIKVA